MKTPNKTVIFYHVFIPFHFTSTILQRSYRHINSFKMVARLFRRLEQPLEVMWRRVEPLKCARCVCNGERRARLWCRVTVGPTGPTRTGASRLSYGLLYFSLQARRASLWPNKTLFFDQNPFCGSRKRQGACSFIFTPLPLSIWNKMSSNVSGRTPTLWKLLVKKICVS